MGKTSTLAAAGKGKTHQPPFKMAPRNIPACLHGIAQGIASQQRQQAGTHWPSGAADALPTGTCTVRIGPSVTIPKPIIPDPYKDISSHGTNLSAGFYQASHGLQVTADSHSLAHAAVYYKSSASLAPSAIAAVQYGPSSDLSTMSGPTTAAGRPERNALVNSRPVPQPQGPCTNCGTSKCPGKTWRRGPDGLRTLCNACGLRYQRHGAGRLHQVSRAAMAAAPELATVPAAPELAAVPAAQLPLAQLPLAQLPLAHTSSACNNYVAQPETSQPRTAAPRPAIQVTANKPSSNLRAAAPAAQTRPTLQPSSSAAEQVTESSNLRRSQRPKRPRVAYDETDALETGRASRAKTSLTTAPAIVASPGSKSSRPQRHKRPREATGEAETLHPGKLNRTRKVASAAAAAAASGGNPQADRAVPGLEAYQSLHTELEATGRDVDLRAEALRVLSVVAPGSSGVRLRKSCRIAQRKERQREEQTASMAAATEAEEAAQTLLGIAACCWVEPSPSLEDLVAVLDSEMDGF